MEEKKKVPVILVLIIGIIIGGVSYFGIDKLLIKNGTKCNVQEEKTEEATSDIEIKYYGIDDESFDPSNILDYQLMARIEEYKVLDEYNKEFNEKDKFTNQELLYFGLSKLNFPDQFTLDELEEVLSKYIDQTVEPENIECIITDQEGIAKYTHLYDEKTGEFTLNEEHGGHGGTQGLYNIIERFVESSIEGNKYYITVYKAYSNIAPDIGIGESAYYSSIEEAIEDKNKLFEVDYDFEAEPYPERKTDVLKEFRKIPDSKLTKVKYTFEHKNNNYVLKEIKIG